MRHKVIWISLLTISLLASPAMARTCTSAGNGNWNTTATWAAGCAGGPVAGDAVTISNNNTVTVTANAAADTLTIAGGANNSTLTINGGVALTINGNAAVNASTAGGTNKLIDVLANAQLTINGNLTLTAGTSATRTAQLRLGNNAATTVTVTGSINVGGTTAGVLVTFQGAGTLNVGGDFGNGATFAAVTGTVVYNGGGAQNLGTYTYNNLVINKSGGVATATASASAAQLQFAASNAGIVTMSSGTLTVTGTCPANVVQSGAGWVNGNLRLTFAAGPQTCTFPLGDASNYSPISITTTGGGAGTLTADVSNVIHPQTATWPLSSTNFVRRYWTLGAATDTLTVTSYSATMNWVAGDIQGGANYQNFIVGEYTGTGGWLVPTPTSSSNTATSIVASGITTVFTTPADLVVGEPFACLPPANVPFGVVCVCDNFGRATLNPSSIFNSNWLLSTSSGTFGIPKIVNQGRLELTDNTGNNATAATVPGIFPAAGNYISVEFKQYAYNGTGADGIAITLSDYSVAPTPGAYGGSLGYAQKTGINGFAGGWIGVALDEFGNYENNTEGRVGGACGGLCPDSVGIRGSGSGNAATATNYPWLAGNTTIGNIDQPGAAAGPGYMYQVIVDATGYSGGTKKALVSVNRDATTKTGANYTPVVAAFDAYVVNPSQAAVPVNWQISFTGSTGGSTNVHEIGNLKVCAQTFIPPTSNGTAAGFNAIDSVLPNTKQNALFGHIYMKVASVPFKLNVAALAPAVGGVSQGVNTTYASGGNKTVTVKLIDDSQAGTSCNSSASACTACAKTVLATQTQTMTFTAADAGFKTSANFTVADAYKRLIAQMSDGTTTGCSTDAFSVRPAYYTLTSSVSTPTKAGTSFTITATPRDVNNASLTQATGAPTLDSTKAPTAGGNQTLLLQSWNTGAAFGSFIYNDVGSFTLPVNAIYDAQFGNAAGEAQDRTNGDCNPGTGASPYVPNICYGYSGASCTNATPWNPDASGKYSCDIGSAASPSIGRFYPDHYEASVAMTQGCSTDAFTYMGQPYSMTSTSAGAIQIKALAAGQTFATAPGLPSYTGAYTPRANIWFGAQDPILRPGVDLIGCVATTPNATANRCTVGANTPPYKAASSNAWTAGVYTASTTTFYFDPPKDATTTPDVTWGPYDNLYIGLTVSDSDGSTLTIPAGQSFVLNTDTYLSINGATPVKERYGRMRVQNATGSEQVPLPVPVFLEYWNGTGWALNALDATCTRLAAGSNAFAGNGAAAACFGNTVGPVAPTCSSTTTGSVGSIYTTRVKTVGANTVAPSYASPQFSFGQRNVVLSAPKASGTINMSVEAPSWLKLGPNDPTGINPSASIRFGTYNSRFIFLRENY
jgi:MSHA biogenesis protein MshQ